VNSFYQATFMAGADPASKVRGCDFSNIWQPSLITASLL